VIALSIVRNGQYRAIVVRVNDGARTILAGNHTRAAMHKLAAKPPTLDEPLDGIPDDERADYEAGARALLDQITRKVIRCELIECSDDEARRINLADTRIPEQGTYDEDALAALLSSMYGDYDGTGWTADDVGKLLDPPELPDDEGDEPEPEERWLVVVECDSEGHQRRLLETFSGEGLNCRALL
jgi:ParB-like chromosome segregation protein Spo0J